MKRNCNVATLIERYFTERLMRQRNVSANTIASYRDTFRLLFTFAQIRLRKAPSSLELKDLEAPFISAFLADLETKRGASVRTRLTPLRADRSRSERRTSRRRRPRASYRQGPKGTMHAAHHERSTCSSGMD